jgi:hypothetical protein
VTLFDDYKPLPGTFDEIVNADGARPAFRRVLEQLDRMTPDELARYQQLAELALLNQGGCVEPAEAHGRLHGAGPATRATTKRDPGDDAVAAAGEQREKAGGLAVVGRLAEHPAAERDHGVGGEDRRRVVGGVDRLGLGHGEAQRTDTRAFAANRAFVDLGGEDEVGNDPDLGEQRAPARAGRAEDQQAAT